MTVPPTEQDINVTVTALNLAILAIVQVNMEERGLSKQEINHRWAIAYDEIAKVIQRMQR